jgi:hypothetical protein
LRLAALLIVSLLGCGPGSPSGSVELRDLELRDSTYFEPRTLEPYTGRVSSTFLTDPEHIQIEGEMLDGRIRYQGRLERGVRCGAWTENTDPRPPSNVYEELVTEIESLGLYPPCSEDVRDR